MEVLLLEPEPHSGRRPSWASRSHQRWGGEERLLLGSLERAWVRALQCQASTFRTRRRHFGSVESPQRVVRLPWPPRTVAESLQGYLLLLVPLSRPLSGCSLGPAASPPQGQLRSRGGPRPDRIQQVPGPRGRGPEPCQCQPAGTPGDGLRWGWGGGKARRPVSGGGVGQVRGKLFGGGSCAPGPPGAGSRPDTAGQAYKTLRCWMCLLAHQQPAGPQVLGLSPDLPNENLQLPLSCPVTHRHMMFQKPRSRAGGTRWLGLASPAPFGSASAFSDSNWGDWSKLGCPRVDVEKEI